VVDRARRKLLDSPAVKQAHPAVREWLRFILSRGERSTCADLERASGQRHAPPSSQRQPVETKNERAEAATPARSSQKVNHATECYTPKSR
jgi:hypothetical protein